MNNVTDLDDFRAQRDAMEKVNHQEDPLQHGGGKGTFDGMSEGSDHSARISRLEMGFCVAFMILIAAIGGLYLYVGGKNDRIIERIETVNGRIGNVDVGVARIDQRTTDMDKKLDEISAKLNKP